MTEKYTIPRDDLLYLLGSVTPVLADPADNRQWAQVLTAVRAAIGRAAAAENDENHKVRDAARAALDEFTANLCGKRPDLTVPSPAGFPYPYPWLYPWPPYPVPYPWPPPDAIVVGELPGLCLLLAAGEYAKAALAASVSFADSAGGLAAALSGHATSLIDTGLPRLGKHRP